MQEQDNQVPQEPVMPEIVNTDDNLPGSTHLNEALADSSALEAAEQALAEQKDKYLRLMAEFENFKRRTAKERIELIQTAGKEVITSLLDVLDDCDRAEKVLQTAGNETPAKEGILLVFNKLRSTLQHKGVKQMETIGSPFDVDQHEAITEIPAPTPDMAGKVIDEVQKGYLLNDKIIRFAKVVVAKGE